MFVSQGNDANAHADSDRQRMQPVSARLPGWKGVQLLLWHLGVHAALSTLLCTSLFRADPGTDSYADTNPHTNPNGTHHRRRRLLRT
jgi:hypothetical protein